MPSRRNSKRPNSMVREVSQVWQTSSARRHLREPPEREREANGRSAIKSPSADLPWHHGDHRPALLALVASHSNEHHSRSLTRRTWPEDLPLPQAITVKPKLPSSRSTRHATSRTPCRANGVHRRCPLRPALDINVALYNLATASILFLQTPNRSTTRRRPRYKPPSRHPFLWWAPRRCSVLRAALYTIAPRDARSCAAMVIQNAPAALPSRRLIEKG